MNYERIRQVCRLRNCTLKRLCEEVKLTEAGLQKMIKNESMKVETLEKISKVLEVHPSVWFFDLPVDPLDKVIRSIDSNFDFISYMVSLAPETEGAGNNVLEVLLKQIDIKDKRIDDLFEQMRIRQE